MRLRHTLPCLLLAAFAAACATPVTEKDVSRQLTEAARPYAGKGPQQVIPVYAESKMVAIGLLGEARTQTDSYLSRRIGLQLARAHRRGAHAVVGGPYPDLSDRVLANALTLNRTGQLRGLNVVFVSAETPSSELIAASRASQTRIHHRLPR